MASKLLQTLSVLTIAVTLATVNTGCSNENLAIEQQPEVNNHAASKVHITVGTGIDESSTRSAVVLDGGARKLTFTAGDKLYVKGVIAQDENSNDLILAGFLDIAGTPAAGATSAYFEGDLTVYKYNETTYLYESGPSITYDFGENDPLAVCMAYYENDNYKRVFAQLVHKDSEQYLVFDYSSNFAYATQVKYLNVISPDVNTLMTTCLPVIAPTYDTANKRFSLVGGIYEPFGINYGVFNCSISGLTPNASYWVILNGAYQEQNSYGTVTANAGGTGTFAIYALALNYKSPFSLTFINPSNPSDVKTVDLGQKAVQNKIYNITKTAVDGTPAVGIPVVSGCNTAPNIEYKFFKVYDNPTNITFSGDCNYSDREPGYRFYIMNDGTVHLNNFTTLCREAFIECSSNSLNIELTGNNAITVTNENVSLISRGTLKLSCTGASATLTVTDLVWMSDHNFGIYATNYNPDAGNNQISVTDTECDVTAQLAADGFTVTRSAGTYDINTDLYYWTYTVTKN